MLEPATALILAWIAAVGLIVHSDALLATLVGLGLGGAFIAGVVGVGGAIVVIPLLLYVPPALGVGSIGMHDISAIAMVQVLAAAASGVAGHLRKGSVDARLVFTMGSGMMLGAFAGAVGSRWLSPETLTGIFATMATAAAIMIVTYRPPRGLEGDARAPLPRSGLLGFVVAMLVGLLAGAVGAGGVFLLAPIMLQVLRIPVRVVVGSSLGIAFLAAVSGVAGKLLTGQVPGWMALALVAGALPGGQFGAAVSVRMRPGQVRVAIGVLMVTIALTMWWDLA